MKTGTENGLGTLEGAACLIFLLLLASGAVAVSAYLQSVDAAKAAMDRVFAESSMNPLLLQFQQELDGKSGTLQHPVNDAALKTFLDEGVDAAAAKLAKLSSKYLVEAGYLRIAVDEQSGKVKRAQTAALAYGTRAGRGVAARQAMAETELGLLAANKLAELERRGAVLGAPTAVFGLGLKNYLPTKVMVVARALVELDDGLTRQMFSAWKLEAAVVDSRAVVLRGEVQ